MSKSKATSKSEAVAGDTLNVLPLKIADWVDDYAETLLGSEYSGRIEREDCIEGLSELFYEMMLGARLEELEYMKRFMISTSPFIEEILDPRIVTYELRLSSIGEAKRQPPTNKPKGK